MHPKVAIGGIASAVTIIIVWGLSYAHVQVPPEVASAFTTIIGVVAGYLTPSGDNNQGAKP